MIVVSGALAVIAFILLIAGLVASGLTLVYASIVVSAVAFVFLGIGAYQRRGEEVAASLATSSPLATESEELTRVVPVSPASVPTFSEPADVEEAEEEFAGADEPEVFIVPGRPRYHVAGCRYLSGRDSESRTRSEALTEGYSACGVCRPDDVLAGVGAAAPTLAALPDAPEPEPLEAEPVEAEPIVEEAAPVGRPGTRRTATAGSGRTAAKKTAAARTTSTKSAAAKKTAAPASRGKVIVIPDRGKFHRADCRFVRDADATLELTKAAASKQGYTACGVCKP